MATVPIKNASGANVDVQLPLPPGTAAASESKPVTLSTEDKALLTSIVNKLISAPATAANQATVISALATIVGLVDGIETLIGGTNSRLDILHTDLSTGSGDPATETTLATAANAIVAMNAKVPAAPATAAAQGTGNTSLANIDAKLPALGAKNVAGSLSIAPATDAIFQQGAPRGSAGTIVSAVTDAVTGSNFTAFGAQACTALNVLNTHPDAVDIEVRRGSSGAALNLPAGSAYTFIGITNSNQIQVRRQDNQNVASTVTGDALS